MSTQLGMIVTRMGDEAGGTLGSRIKKVREDFLGLDSARKLAALLKDVPGADHNSIGKYERDERQPNPMFLAALVRRANINGHWLLTGEGDAQPLDEAEAVLAIRYIEKLIEELRAGARLHPPDDLLYLDD